MPGAITMTDVAMVAVIVTITAGVVRKSYGVGLERIIKGLEQALAGDHDVRVTLHRNDTIGRLSRTIDLLLAQRASESLEADGALEEATLKERRLEEVIDAGLAIAPLADPERIVDETLVALMRLTPSRRGLLSLDGVLWERNEKRYRRLPAEAPVPRFLRWAMEERREDYTNNVTFDDRCDEGWDEGAMRGEALAAPLVVDGRTRGGALLIGRGIGYGPDDLLAVRTLLRHAAVPLASASVAPPAPSAGGPDSRSS